MKKKTILVCIIFYIIAAIFTFIHPAKITQNLVHSMFSSKNIAAKLNLRYSSEINVIIESNSKDKTNETYNDFLKQINENSTFDILQFNREELIETYKKHYKNLLSNTAYQLLKNEDYSGVTLSAYERLFDPLSVTSIELKDDPFMLFSDYLKYIGNNSEDTLISYENKFYKIILLGIKNQDKINTTQFNEQMKELINLQQNLSSDETSIYLTGIPVSSYYAGSKMRIELNVIWIFSILLLVLVCNLYFANLKIIFPILISTALAILSGYFICDLFFTQMDIASILFASVFVSVLSAYTIYYFVNRDIEKIFKDLTICMAICIFTFVLVMFSGIEFIKQISVFAIGGLLSLYANMTLFYPFLQFKVVPKNIYFELTKKQKIILSVLILGTICCSYLVKFNDNIQSNYFPTKKLASEQKLYRNISGDIKTSFVVVEGKDLQDILEKEESITKSFKDIEFEAISKYVPSIRRQKENLELKSKLYKHSLKDYATFLNADEEKELLKEDNQKEFLLLENQNLLSEFLIDKNASVIILYNFDNPAIIKDGKYINLQKNLDSRAINTRIAYEYGIFGFILVLFGILYYFYKFKNTIRIIMPPALAGAFAIGLLSILKQEITLFHVISVFIIFGLGIQYPLFQINDKNHTDAPLLSVLITILPLLILAFASYKPVSIAGSMLFIGITMSYICSLIFTPNDDKSELI